LALVLPLAGCPNSYTGGQQPPEQNPPPVQVDDLFVPGEAEGGLTRTVFRTNDERHWKPEGMTVWTVWGDENAEFTTRAVTMAKSAGYSGGGYGIVFCQAERPEGAGGSMEPSMMVVMINNEGRYITGKAVGGIFTDFGWWKDTPYLHRGMGAGNTVAVSYEEEDSEYRLEFNGYVIESFHDPDGATYRQGRNGYIAVITPFDRFPDLGIDVYFTEDR